MNDFPDLQKYLDEATRWQAQEMVELHYLNCECWRCKEVEEIEREKRWELYEHKKVKKL